MASETEFVRELTHEQFMESYDWEYIFDNFMTPQPVLGAATSGDRFDRSDVAEIIAIVEGENDGPDWVGVFRLKDGRYASITAGCDYTGWGCQESGAVQVAPGRKTILRYGLTDEERRRLGVVLPEQEPRDDA